MVFINVFFVLNVVFNLVTSSDIQIQLSKIPNTTNLLIDQSVIISCGTNGGSIIFKRHEIILSLDCVLLTEEKENKLTCNEFNGWYYKNITIPHLKWNHRGEYQCIAGNSKRTIDLVVHVPAELTMKLDNVTYRLAPDGNQYEKGKPEKIEGSGNKDDPFKVMRKIKNVGINCSSSWSFPEALYNWTITRMNSPISKVEEIKEQNFIKTISKDNSTKDMYKTSSLFQLDCLHLKISGLVKVECSDFNQQNVETKTIPHYYFLCPEFDPNFNVNSSRVISKKSSLRLTLGEMINIVIGCTIGVILIIVGIVLICRHRPKDDIDRYTMRQNSVDHPGYRV